MWLKVWPAKARKAERRKRRQMPKLLRPVVGEIGVMFDDTPSALPGVYSHIYGGGVN